MAQQPSALGDYLRARREQVQPEDVGLASTNRRRVVGLRREELATLAGISAAYYLRLEQGRIVNPSAQVVEALARALRLDEKGRKYLYRLAGPVISSWDDTALETVAEGLEDLIEIFPIPAIVANRCQDVLAANPIARALSPGFEPGQNFLRWRLLDPAARELYVDWDEATEVAVSGLRELVGGDPANPRVRALIDELSATSERFRECWGRAEVGYRYGVQRIRHPLVGDIRLFRNQLNVPDLLNCEGQHVLLYRPEPGTGSVEAVERLRALALS